MLLARARVRGRIVHGIVEGETLHVVRGGLFGRREPAGERVPLSEARLLAPTRPSKVVAIGLNYHTHLVAQEDREAPAHPEPFLKTASGDRPR